MKVKDLMIREAITCRDVDALGEAARLMWEHDIGFLPVLADNGEVAGVVTDRDGLMAAFFEGKLLWEISVRSAMATRVATIGSDADVDEAERLMSEFQVHRLPVVDDGKLVGVVSINDLARRAADDENESFEEEVAVTLGAICLPRSSAPPAPAS